MLGMLWYGFSQLQRKTPGLLKVYLFEYLHKGYLYLQTEGVWSIGVIPRGTRFGPFEGTRTPNKPNDKVSWRYYWRVCHLLAIVLN